MDKDFDIQEFESSCKKVLDSFKETVGLLKDVNIGEIDSACILTAMIKIQAEIAIAGTAIGRELIKIQLKAAAAQLAEQSIKHKTPVN